MRTNGRSGRNVDRNRCVESKIFGCRQVEMGMKLDLRRV